MVPPEGMGVAGVKARVTATQGKRAARSVEAMVTAVVGAAVVAAAVAGAAVVETAVVEAAVVVAAPDVAAAVDIGEMVNKSTALWYAFCSR